MIKLPMTPLDPAFVNWALVSIFAFLGVCAMCAFPYYATESRWGLASLCLVSGVVVLAFVFMLIFTITIGG